jgi:hypothetical protein
MLYTDFGRDADGREWPGFFAAFSPDGKQWTGAAENPLNKTAYGGRELRPPFADEEVYAEQQVPAKGIVRKSWKIPLSMSDAADVMYDPKRAAYVAYGKCWIQGPAGGLAWKHAMARTESPDFVRWSPAQIVAAPDELDPPHTEFHTSPVFFHKGVYFCLNQLLLARGERVGAKSDLMQIELMTSRDGLRWERPFRNQPFIPAGQQPFSSGGMFTNSTPVVLDDEIRFYYGGYTAGAIGGGGKLTAADQQSGVGFASIRRDRFAGIRPVPVSDQSTLRRPLANVGQITLRPLNLAGRREMVVNADAADGAVRVEILNDAGYRVRGFSRDDAVPLVGDALDHRVAWRERTLEQLPPGEYHVRLHLENAEVFAVSLR